MTEEIPEHRHCAVCGAVIPYRGKSKPHKVYLCSKQCSKLYEEEVRRTKTLRMMLYIPFIAIILIWIFFILSRGGLS